MLMLGWMDDVALHRTLTTGRTTFFSRSRNDYWTKGETSGHRQWVRGVRLDCDGDTLLVTVVQEGPACHTGDRTCFDARPLPAAPGRPEGGPVSAIRPTPGGVPRAGADLPGDQRLPPAAGRRRDGDRPLRQAGPEPARQLPAGVGGAGRLVALLLHRRPRRRHAHRAGRRGGLDRAHAGRPAGGRRPGGGGAGDPAAAAHPAGRRAAAVHLRAWSATSATTPSAGSSGCPTATPTTWPSPS